MNMTQFLRRLKGMIVTGGDGLTKSVVIPLTDLKTSAGLTLTAGTNPLTAALETNAVGVQWAAGNATAALLNFVVPLDFDKGADLLQVAFMVNSAGNTDAPILDATVYRKRAGAALSADLDPTASSAIPKSATAATAAAERIITLLGKGLQARDILTILVAPGTHGTDAVNVYGVEVRYKSTLVAYADTDR
jgi:hypothetical protein